ncbi:hypothetical protein NE237_013681 [Protea cynaroides]|uniref:GATA-type domain-containing protein n=1 Tax=Protea cynaroides TaxID=273540 RepID=A0A9Q0K0E0_9MAGN|nr:hypothetical protein NE237_013681 [Protea cynaroides]
MIFPIVQPNVVSKRLREATEELQKRQHRVKGPQSPCDHADESCVTNAVGFLVEEFLDFSSDIGEEDEEEDNKQSNSNNFTTTTNSNKTLSSSSSLPLDSKLTNSISQPEAQTVLDIFDPEDEHHRSLFPEFLEELEWITNEDAFPEVETFDDIFPGKLSKGPNNQSPVSVLENSSSSSNSGIMICCASLTVPVRGVRSKRRRRKRSGFSDISGQQWWRWCEPMNKNNGGNETIIGRKCWHCGAEKTPQWRAGPYGPKTLCNACGVRLLVCKMASSSRTKGDADNLDNQDGSEVPPVEPTTDVTDEGFLVEEFLDFSSDIGEEDEEEDNKQSNSNNFTTTTNSNKTLSSSSSLPLDSKLTNSISQPEAQTVLDIFDPEDEHHRSLFPEFLEELEWITNEDAFPEVETFDDIFPGKLSKGPNNQSPVSVLENSSSSSNSGIMICCASLTVPVRGVRSKRRRRKRSGFSDISGQQWWRWCEPMNKNNGGNETIIGRKCWHCGAEKTPQWRAGPYGPKTLCNACGVRYKSGRLVPEYRPASSPSFSSELHSNSHRKILEMRKQKQ